MNKEKNNGKRKLVITMAVALILLVGVTVSYGYIALISNSKNQEISVGTGNIHLELDDADFENVNATLELGQSITKTLKITNKGTKPGKVQIYWKNLINTYTSRSLSYILETSNTVNGTYTKVDTFRANVPVSTEAKNVPLSSEITVPVQSAPIYYRVTITLNDLEDVDQESDLSATLSTQFTLSESSSVLSKKVIAVLDGNIKTNDPKISGPAPRYKYGVYTSESNGERALTDLLTDENSYIIYSDGYELKGNRYIYLKNPQVGKYKDVYSSLIGKYISVEYSDLSEEDANKYLNYRNSYLYLIKSATLDNIIYDECSVKKISSEGNFSAVANQSMSSNQDNYITYGDKYIFDPIAGRYTLENPQVCKWSECYKTLVKKYVLRLTGAKTNAINNSGNSSVYLVDNTDINTLSYLRKYRISNIKDNSYDGVYAMEDDYGTSYFYRGDIKNNYVKFANNYWRILRVNGDGSVRMILADKDDKDGAGNFINNGDNVDFNAKTDDIKYMGYMFGGSTEDAASTSIDDAFENKYSSNVKKALDTWYEGNLASYSNYISDTLFCNDREISRTEGNNTYFKSYDRLEHNDEYNDTPNLKCVQKNDRFTVDDEKVGNGDLTYPIGMVSADELAVAGVMILDADYPSDDNYLHHYKWMLTMTPNTNESRWLTNINWISLEGYSNTSARVSPVINIKPEFALKMVGNGTQTDPFIIPGVN